MNLLLQALLASFDTEEKAGPAAALGPLADAIDAADRASTPHTRSKPTSTIPPVSPPPSPDGMAV